MAITLRFQEQNGEVTPLAALVSHFNASPASVRKAFAKMLSHAQREEKQKALQAKVDDGVREIRSGKGISRNEQETTAQFFDRLCTE